MTRTDPFHPSAALLAKLGSIIVHVQEYHSATGHPWDKQAMDSLLEDGELKEWMLAMDAMAMLPKKR